MFRKFNQYGHVKISYNRGMDSKQIMYYKLNINKTKIVYNFNY